VRAALDITARRFGQLLVQERAGTSRQGVLWRCGCDCGANIVACSIDLRRGRVKSCGCLGREARRSNTSGFTGVWRSNGEWCASIMVGRKRHWLGRHDTLNRAVAARRRAEKRLAGA
jgi:hypothetical protein